jgi:hypothetical protein
LLPAIVNEHLKLHHEANHDVSGAQQDRMQKIGRPVLMTCFRFQTFQRRVGKMYHSIQRYRGEFANMSVEGLMTDIEKEASGRKESKLYEARGNVTTKKGHHTFL